MAYLLKMVDLSMANCECHNQRLPPKRKKNRSREIPNGHAGDSPVAFGPYFFMKKSIFQPLKEPYFIGARYT